MAMEDPEDADIMAMLEEVEQHLQATQTQMNALMMSDEWDSDNDEHDSGGDGDHQEEAMEPEEAMEYNAIEELEARVEQLRMRLDKARTCCEGCTST